MPAAGNGIPAALPEAPDRADRCLLRARCGACARRASWRGVCPGVASAPASLRGCKACARCAGNMARELWVKKASVALLADVEHSVLESAATPFECGVGGCKTVLHSEAGE